MKRFFSLIASVAVAVTGFAADFEQTVTALIPKLADSDVPARYEAQMRLQDLASQSSRPGHAAEREALGKVLAAEVSDAAVPQPARVWMVRQLEYMGGAEAVPALTELLASPDAELRECARRALEKNPAPAAAQSLWAALEKAATDREAEAVRWKVGLINSLGEKGDSAAVGLIVPRLNEAGTATAAALALGKIASPSAVKALWSSLGKNPAAADGLVLAADRLSSRDRTAAKEVAMALIDANIMAPQHGAALVVLAKIDPTAAARPIAAALASDQPRLQQSALSAAETVYGERLTSALLPLLPRLNASAKVQALAVLDAAAESEIIRAATETDDAVRRAALTALGRVGGASSVPVLLRAATDDSKGDKSTAEAALSLVHGDGARAAILQAAAGSDSKVRAAAINALAARSEQTAIPALLKYAGDADSTVKRAALGALRNMAGEAEIEPLARMVVAGKSEASSALEAAAQRAEDKSAAVKTLTGLAGNDPKKLAALLGPLSLIGGDDALAVVVKLTESSDAEIRGDAVRALGSWTDFAAAKALLAIASDTATPQTQYVLAMQGLTRLVRSVESESAERRVDLAVAAMNAARRPEEKKLALSALAAVPHRKAAAAIKPLLSDPQLKAEACAAGLTLAEALVRPDKKTARDLAAAVKAATDSSDLQKRADRVLSR